MGIGGFVAATGSATGGPAAITTEYSFPPYKPTSSKIRLQVSEYMAISCDSLLFKSASAQPLCRRNSLKSQGRAMGSMSVSTHAKCDPDHSLVTMVRTQLEGPGFWRQSDMPPFGVADGVLAFPLERLKQERRLSLDRVLIFLQAAHQRHCFLRTEQSSPAPCSGGSESVCRLRQF